VTGSTKSIRIRLQHNPVFRPPSANPGSKGGQNQNRSRLVRNELKNLIAQLLALNQEVAAKIERGELVTAPGVPQYYPDAKKLVTEDCIRPGA
jgi:hypothetical protein